MNLMQLNYSMVDGGGNNLMLSNTVVEEGLGGSGISGAFDTIQLVYKF